MAHKDVGAKSLFDNLPKRKRTASSDPLVRSVKKIRAHWRKTPLGRLRTLWEEESKWRRKMTIARNKHGKVLAKIERLAEELAELLTKEKGGNEKPGA